MKHHRLTVHHHNCKPTAHALHHSRPERRGRGNLVSLGGLFALLVFALGLAGLLIPRQSELVKRLVQDGRHDRALALVGEDVSSEKDGDAIASTPAGLVELLLDSIDNDFDDTSRVRINALINITEDPAGVHEVLRERRQIIPVKLLPELLNHLAIRAVQTGDPAYAVKLYDELTEISPLTLEQVHACVTAARYAGKPDRALAVVSRHLEIHRIPFTQLPESLRKLTVSLHRELNHGSVAFDLLSEEFKATLEPEAREELVELIATVAAQSQRLPDSLPILKEFLNGTEAGHLDWRELAVRETPAANDANFQKFGRMLAQNYEWNNRSSEAFDLYRKLAVMGETDALDRCVTIYPWVDRQGDLTDLLEVLSPVPDREEYTLLLARLQSERGQFLEAEKIYRTELAGKHAQDVSVWSELAGILDAQDRFTEARDTFRTALKIDDTRHDIRVKLARLHVTLGDHPAALAEYKKLPPEAHDRKTREDFAMLAKSLDSPRDFIRAIQLKLDAKSGAEPGAFLDMANAWESLTDFEAMEETLRDGLVQFPKSSSLILGLADHMIKQGRKEEAFDLLAKVGQIEDKRYAARLLSLGYETARFEETIQLVASKPVAWSPSERFDLASLYEEIGNAEAALAQFRQAEGGEADTARLEAEVAFTRGDVTTALRRQKDYLDLNTEPDYEAWTFYGDLQRAAGRTTEAEESYRAALEQLKIQLSSNPVPPVEDPEVAVTR